MMKYFGEQGQELFDARPTDNRWLDEKFPGVNAVKADGYNKWIGYESKGALVNATYIPVVRIIEWKKTAEPHKCDSQCEDATGHKCECSCGGANHGKNRYLTPTCTTFNHGGVGRGLETPRRKDEQFEQRFDRGNFDR